MIHFKSKNVVITVITMVSLQAIIACLGIVFAAIVALFIFGVENFVATNVNSQLETAIPQSTPMIEKGQQLDDVKSNLDDANHANLAASKGTFNAGWGFATPFAIIIIAALAIYRKLS